MARLLKDAPPLAHDRVVLDYDQRLMRRKLLTSVGGRAFLVDLPSVTNLDDYWGFEVDGVMVEIVAAPEAVLVISGDLTRLAWHIGNRHTPCEVRADRLVIREDHVLERMLLGLGAEVRRESLPFRPEGGAYGMGRTMGHAHTEAEAFGWHDHGDGKPHFHAPKAGT